MWRSTSKKELEREEFSIQLASQDLNFLKGQVKNGSDVNLRNEVGGLY